MSVALQFWGRSG